MTEEIREPSYCSVCQGGDVDTLPTENNGEYVMRCRTCNLSFLIKIMIGAVRVTPRFEEE